MDGFINGWLHRWLDKWMVGWTNVYGYGYCSGYVSVLQYCSIAVLQYCRPRVARMFYKNHCFWFIHPLSQNLQNIFKPLELGTMRQCSLPPVTCHMSNITCHISCATYHVLLVPHVMCHMSCVKCHVSYFICHMLQKSGPDPSDSCLILIRQLLDFAAGA